MLEEVSAADKVNNEHVTSAIHILKRSAVQYSVTDE
jgi:hypothetical protein